MVPLTGLNPPRSKVGMPSLWRSSRILGSVVSAPKQPASGAMAGAGQAGEWGWKQ